MAIETYMLLEHWIAFCVKKLFTEGLPKEHGEFRLHNRWLMHGTNGIPHGEWTQTSICVCFDEAIRGDVS
jgi:hypothetical protein